MMTNGQIEKRTTGRLFLRGQCMWVALMRLCSFCLKGKENRLRRSKDATVGLNPFSLKEAKNLNDLDV